MTLPTVSVVVVGQGRPAALARCLAGLARLRYPDFEIVVVADAPGLQAVEAHPDLFGQVKTRSIDGANAQAARNAGIAAAAGEVVAFIAEDAVPEPLWLQHLAAPFRDPRASAAGGYVIGDDGIGPRWTGQSITAANETAPLAMEDDTPALFTAEPGLGIGTSGTNMAARREVLTRLGGFDPAFRSSFAEADLNLRLSAERGSTALVPLAQVHCGTAARAPDTLSEAGADLMIFLRKHAPPDRHDRATTEERARHRRRLERHLVAGRIEPRDISRRMARFETGLAEGRQHPLDPPPPLSDATPDFLPYRPVQTRTDHRVFGGGLWRAARLREAARQAARTGATVTLILTDLSARPHRVRFDPAGYWEQTGGLFGPSARPGPRVRLWRRADRIAAECRRVTPLRGESDFAVSRGN